MILTADWHLTDHPNDEYRWEVFSVLRNHSDLCDDRGIYILGDLTDRKDRHSASLVNRLVKMLKELPGKKVIIKGNHDAPLKGPPFWNFLNELPDVIFVDTPQFYKNIWLLPYTHKPIEAWADLTLSTAHAAFMHQTVTGVIADNGRVLTNDSMPIFPNKLPIYSGDIHTPQIVGNVTYVGAPHPIKFGDTYPCRMLVLDGKFKIRKAVTLSPMQKLIITIGSTDELDHITNKTYVGDQVRIRFNISVNKLEQWPVIQEEIKRWIAENELALASLEAIVQIQPSDNPDMAQNSAQAETPKEVLEAFCTTEGISGDMAFTGQQLLKSALNAPEKA